MSDLSFTIYGSVCSNNRVTRRVGPKSLKSKEARDDTKRIREIATVAATSASWSMPGACCVEILAFSVRPDIDNLAKVILDSMSGVVYHDDRDIMELALSKHWDNAGERFVVTVMACDDRRPGRKSKPRPNGVRPLSKIPQGALVNYAERDAILAKALR